MPEDPYAAYQQPAAQAGPGGDPYAAYQQPITPEQSRGFLGSLWDEVKKGPANLLGVGNSINQAVLHPVDTLAGMGKGISDMAGKTAESFKRGDYAKAASQAVNTGLNAVVPGLGSSSEEAGEKLERGDIAGGLGQTAAIGINTALGVKAPQIMGAAAKALPKPLNPEGSSLGALTRANPRVAIDRALTPAAADPGFTDRIPTTLQNVKGANAGVAPATNLEMIPAVQKAIESHQGIFDQWMQRAGGRKVSGGPIIQATEKATQGMLPSEQAAGAAQIERAMVDYGRDFTPQELKARLELLNKRINSFASQSPGKQSAALADIPEAVLKAQRDATADTLYRALDPEGAGAGPRLIQRQIGDMISLKEAGLARKNAIIKEQAVSPLGALSDKFGKAARKALPTRVGLTTPDAMAGRSDPLIRRSFEAVGEPNAVPRPGTDLYPTGDNTKLLTAGDAVPPPPPDTSFVRAAQGMNQPLNPRRALPSPDILTPPPPDTSFARGVPPDAGQAATAMPKALPPGSAPFTRGTSVPDVQGRPDLRAPYSRGLLAAPEPGEPPVNAPPRGPGSVQTPPYMPQEAGNPIPMEGQPAAPESLEHRPEAPSVPPSIKAEPEAPEAVESSAVPTQGGSGEQAPPQQQPPKPEGGSAPTRSAPVRQNVGGLPPVADGMVRVYRGEMTPGHGSPAPDWVLQSDKYKATQEASGRWWTENPELAQWYVNDAGEHGRLQYQDVPRDVAEQGRVINIPEARRFSADPDNELFLPKAYAGRGQDIPDLTSPSHSSAQPSPAASPTPSQAEPLASPLTDTPKQIAAPAEPAPPEPLDAEAALGGSVLNSEQPAAPESLEQNPEPPPTSPSIKTQPEAPTPLGTPPPTKPSGITESLQSAADEALERMRKRGTFSGTQLNSLVPASDLKDMAIWGAAKIAKGTVKFKQWAAEMVADAGDQIKPHLEQMYAASQKEYAKRVLETDGKLVKLKKLISLMRILTRLFHRTRTSWLAPGRKVLNCVSLKSHGMPENTSISSSFAPG